MYRSTSSRSDNSKQINHFTPGGPLPNERSGPSARPERRNKRLVTIYQLNAAHNSSRMNTCKSVSKQRTLSPFPLYHFRKTPGGVPTPDPPPVAQPFSAASSGRRQRQRTLHFIGLGSSQNTKATGRVRAIA